MRLARNKSESPHVDSYGVLKSESPYVDSYGWMNEWMDMMFEFVVRRLHWLARIPLAAHLFKHSTRFGNKGQRPHFAICSSYRVTAHNNFASVKIGIAPGDLARFANPTTCKCQARCQIWAIV